MNVDATACRVSEGDEVDLRCRATKTAPLCKSKRRTADRIGANWRGEAVGEGQTDVGLGKYVGINYYSQMTAHFSIDPRTISSTCLCLGLRRAARAVSRRFDSGLRPVGLNSGQFSMLTAIAGLQPVGMQALAEHLAMDRTTVTAGLKPLQRRGLVEVDVSANDLRARDARLSAQGTALLAKAMPLWQQVQREVSAAVPAPESKSLRRHLAALS